jgi:hypothetical protein
LETAGLIAFRRFLNIRGVGTNTVSRAASLNSAECAIDLSAKAGLLILAGAWHDLAEQTTQTVDHEADEPHSMIEQPLKRVSVQGQ